MNASPKPTPFPLERNAAPKTATKSKHEIETHKMPWKIPGRNGRNVVRHLSSAFSTGSRIQRWCNPERKHTEPEGPHAVGQGHLDETCSPEGLAGPWLSGSWWAWDSGWPTSPGEKKKRGKMPKNVDANAEPKQAACRYDVMQPETHQGPIPPREEKV